MAKPVLRLVAPQRVLGTDFVAPIQYSLRDTARLLSVSLSTVNRLVARGELPTVGRGRLRRIPFDAIVEWQERNKNEAA